MKTILTKCGINTVKRIEKTIRIKKENWNTVTLDNVLQTTYSTPIDSFNINTKSKKMFIINVDMLDFYNKNLNLNMDKDDITYYTDLFKNKIKRHPTSIELFDLAQSNSEHSRHWFFNGKLCNKSIPIEQTLFQMVKSTLTPHNSVIAFSDNSSAIKGYNISTLIPQQINDISSSTMYKYTKANKEYDITLTAETHNFPTGIAPFPGAATGIGGRIRDNQSIGRGGLIIASSAGYCVGNLFLKDYPLPWEVKHEYHKKISVAASKILIEASNGASDYGNKIGEPIIIGFTRSFGMILPNKDKVEWVKPIMFTAGIGQMDHVHIKKNKPTKGMKIVRLGGPAYKIGVGGGSASSRVHDTKNNEQDMSAVQRGDPEMENKLNRVVRTCIEMGDDNPIESIHDQGAGGLANVTKEIIEPNGGFINLQNVTKGSTNMSAQDIWTSEFQESDTCLINENNMQHIDKICKRENLLYDVMGDVTDTGKIVVYDSTEDNYPVNLDLKYILSDIPQKMYTIQERKVKTYPFLHLTTNILEALGKVFRLVSVGSKQFLTNKVDRSVTGLIAQQQCIGRKHLPLSDYAVVAQSHFGVTGAVTAIGEQPIKGLICADAMAKMTIGELLTNMMWVKIQSIEHIKCSGNWMWPLKQPGEKYKLYEACKSMCDTLKELGVSIDGGKDSLSMSSTLRFDTVKGPSSLVLSGYADCPDIRNRVTADFKRPGNDIIFVDLGLGKNRMGGSAYAQTNGQLGSEVPTIENIGAVKKLFNIIQECVDKKYIVAGHDKSDGGLITTLLEMCFPSRLGCYINLHFPEHKCNEIDLLEFLFNEELGVVIEVNPDYLMQVNFLLSGFKYHIIGRVSAYSTCTLKSNSTLILEEYIPNLLQLWQNTSFELEKLQCNVECATKEKEYYLTNNVPSYFASLQIVKSIDEKIEKNKELVEMNRCKYKVGIIREEGSNGDREMASAFYMAGFDVYDVNTHDLIENPNLLDDFVGIVFVGGFSFSDVLGAGKGWYNVLKFNKKIKESLYTFYEREDTFSFGVCNGCQLMSQFEVFDDVKLEENKSGRFESRFSNVTICNTNSIMLKGMVNMCLGVWVAHKEGQFIHKGSSTIAMQYVDSKCRPTTEYPMNPNGSIEGIAGLCSEDGRHLIMMPHPERTFLTWQVPYVPEAWRENKYYPWMLMFKNAYEWCCGE